MTATTNNQTVALETAAAVLACAKLFRVEYTWDRGRRCGCTVVSGPSREQAVAEFARLHPDVEVVA